MWCLKPEPVKKVHYERMAIFHSTLKNINRALTNQFKLNVTYNSIAIISYLPKDKYSLRCLVSQRDGMTDCEPCLPAAEREPVRERTH